MADTSGAKFALNVTFGVQLPGVPPVSDQTTTNVEAIVQIQEVVPADGKPVAVQVTPDRVKQPAFLMIRPFKVADQEVKKQDDWAKVKVTYATVKADGTPLDRRALTGTHVFANGMAGWVTDLAADGTPGPLTTLIFWNDPLPAPDAKTPAPPPQAVTLLIVAGYCPDRLSAPGGGGGADNTGKGGTK